MKNKRKSEHPEQCDSMQITNAVVKYQGGIAQLLGPCTKKL
jgi:hypothetical protein